MELKNISEKVISVGSEIVMPDKVIDITEERAAAPSIKALIKQGYVSVTKKSGTTGTKKQAVDTPEPTGTFNAEEVKLDGDKPADEPANNAENPAETEATAGKRGKNK